VTKFLKNNWRAIRAFYREAMPDIVRAGSNEWGFDPYEWSIHGIIHLTPIEEWLWHDIRACNAVMYPQFPVLDYFVDFANPVAKVVIECDGAEFHDEAKDAVRDRNLLIDGWTVYRFPGWMCATDADPETGAPGEAKQRLREICEAHRISRFSRTQADEEKSGRGNVALGDELPHLFARDAAIAAAVRRAM
jgi:hypothetical protein